MPSFARKHWKAILLLFVLLPTILFASAYAVGSTGIRTERYAQSPGGWSVNMTVSHPTFVYAGQVVAVTLSLGINAASNYSIGVADVGVEMRQPAFINSTSGVVGAWEVLGSSRVNVNKNLTGSTYLTKVLTMVATSQQTAGALDLLSPTSGVSYNGVADLTVYQLSGNDTSANPLTVSLLDSETYYQTELSTMVSTSSWVTYQLLAAVAGLVIFVKARPPSFGAPTDSYSMGLKSYRTQRALARLEEMLKSGTIGRHRYEELKNGFLKELERLRGGDSRR